LYLKIDKVAGVKLFVNYAIKKNFRLLVKISGSRDKNLNNTCRGL